MIYQHAAERRDAEVAARLGPTRSGNPYGLLGVVTESALKLFDRDGIAPWRGLQLEGRGPDLASQVSR